MNIKVTDHPTVAFDTRAPRVGPGVYRDPITAQTPNAAAAVKSYRPGLKTAYPGAGEIETSATLASYLERKDIDWRILRYTDGQGGVIGGVHLNVFVSEGRKVAVFEQGWAKKSATPEQAASMFRDAIAEARAQGATRIYIETNDPNVWGAADAKRTAFRADNQEFIEQFGFKRVKGHYAQPVLEKGEQPVEGLDLVVLDLKKPRASTQSAQPLLADVRAFFASFAIFMDRAKEEAPHTAAGIVDKDPTWQAFARSVTSDTVELLPLRTVANGLAPAPVSAKDAKGATLAKDFTKAIGDPNAPGAKSSGRQGLPDVLRLQVAAKG